MTTYRVTFRPDEAGNDTLYSRVITSQEHVGFTTDGGEIIEITTDTPAQLERDLNSAACVVRYEQIN